MFENSHYWATIGEQGQFYAALIVKDDRFANAFISSEEPVKIDVEPIMEAFGHKRYSFILKSKTGKYYTFNCVTGILNLELDATTVNTAGISNGNLYWHSGSLLNVGNHRIPCNICPRYVCWSNGVCLFDCGDELKSYYNGVLRSVGKHYPIKPFKDCCLSIYDRRSMHRNLYFELFSVLYHDGDVWFGEAWSDGNYVAFNEDSVFDACPSYENQTNPDFHEKIVYIGEINDTKHYYVTEFGYVCKSKIECGFECFYNLDTLVTSVLKLTENTIVYVTGCDIVKTKFENESDQIICSFDSPIVSVIYREVIIVCLADGSVHRVESDGVTRIPFFDSNPIAKPTKACIKNARKV